MTALWRHTQLWTVLSSMTPFPALATGGEVVKLEAEAPCMAAGQWEQVVLAMKIYFNHPHGLVHPTKHWIKSSQQMKWEHLPRHAQAQVGHSMNARGGVNVGVCLAVIKLPEDGVMTLAYWLAHSQLCTWENLASFRWPELPRTFVMVTEPFAWLRPMCVGGELMTQLFSGY